MSMKSIMQIPDGRCYLCEMLGDYSEKRTEVHHCIFGTSGRKLSERYGLKVYLCPEHHRTGKQAVHNNHLVAALLQDKAQAAFDNYFKSYDFFVKFGRNYRISEEERLEAMNELRGKLK